MYETTETLETNASAAEAFDHIARGFFENHQRWDPMVVGMEKTSDGPIGVGTTGRETRAVPGGRKVSNDVRVTVFEPDSHFAFEATSGPLRERMDCKIEPAGRGSRVRVHLAFTAAAWWMRLMTPLMARMLAHNVRTNMERFRAALDQDTAQPAARSQR